MSETSIEVSPNKEAFATPAFTQEPAYRSVCKSAVAAIIFAVLGLSAFMAQMFMILPVIGIIFGLLGLKAIRAYPDELVGAAAAKIGLVLSAICLVASGAMHSFIYATEVPDGYRRISFAELKPSSRGTDANAYPDRAIEFDQQRVFVKGYVRPPSGKQYNLKTFIMVGDFGDCCFGGNPEATDVIAVKIKSEDTVNYGYGLRRIGGIFKLNRQAKMSHEDDIPRVYYEIEADYVR